jgi:Ca-activated chloride channel family protein
MRTCRAIALLLLLPAMVRAEAGVLIPWSLQHEPDPAVLSLEEMHVSVRIDHLHAEVRMKQIFRSHTDRVLEGRYVLPLGERAAVEDFSVWDGEERLVGVVVEKQRGKQLFETIKARIADPGLAETEDDKDKGRQFALRVFPIPARGTARVEVVWSEDLQVSSMAALFTLPLAARHYGAQRAARVHVDMAVSGAWPLAETKLSGGAFRTLPQLPGKTGFRAVWEAQDVTFERDVTLLLRYQAGPPQVLTYRAPGMRRDLGPLSGGAVYRDERGFFLLRAILPEARVSSRPRDIVLLLDTSLSMAGEKLDQAAAGLEFLLSRLQPADRFGLVLFSDEARPYRQELVEKSDAEVAAALRFVRAAYLAGGTALSQALPMGLDLLARPRPGAERILLLISDGQVTRGERRGLSRRLLGRGRQPGGARLFVLGIGDDAEVYGLRDLAQAGAGTFAWAREGSAATFTLQALLSRLGQGVFQDARLVVSGLAGIEQVLPQGGLLFPGADVLFAGRYRTPGRAALEVRGTPLGEGGPRPLLQATALLPEQEMGRPWVGRSWARLRVDELLRRIQLEGEDAAWIREVIALAREFHLVTPYTSFIAAPRAMLRPRAIQPGDPVLRVKTAADIRRVAALFPFGLEKSLRYHKEEDVWETRFLAPPWMADGTYSCTLILTDDRGRKLREEKRFVIDSRAPTVRPRALPKLVRPGQALALVADADADTRRLSARLGDGPQVELRWDAGRKGSAGVLEVPAGLASGTYPLIFVAEDFAHNVSQTRVELQVIGGAP